MTVAYILIDKNCQGPIEPKVSFKFLNFSSVRQKSNFQIPLSVILINFLTEKSVLKHGILIKTVFKITKTCHLVLSSVEILYTA